MLERQQAIITVFDANPFIFSPFVSKIKENTRLLIFVVSLLKYSLDVKETLR